jgi:hypothetical protein
MWSRPSSRGACAFATVDVSTVPVLYEVDSASHGERANGDRDRDEDVEDGAELGQGPVGDAVGATVVSRSSAPADLLSLITHCHVQRLCEGQ